MVVVVSAAGVQERTSRGHKPGPDGARADLPTLGPDDATADLPTLGPDGSIVDVAALYRALAGSLERIVRHVVHAPEVVIEDACQFAWSRLVHHRRRVGRERVLGWLVKTAVHEALKLLRRSGTEVSLDAMLEEDGDVVALRSARSVEDLVDARERLRSISVLAPRQQRALWLHALGLSYEEIAIQDGCTERSVERQLYQARKRLRSNELSVRPS